MPSKAQASLSVAIRVRPILKTEVAKNNRRDIIRVIDGKIVVVLDPDESKVQCKDQIVLWCCRPVCMRCFAQVDAVHRHKHTQSAVHSSYQSAVWNNYLA